jgi:hypothetical protein
MRRTIVSFPAEDAFILEFRRCCVWVVARNVTVVGASAFRD